MKKNHRKRKSSFCEGEKNRERERERERGFCEGEGKSVRE